MCREQTAIHAIHTPLRLTILSALAITVAMGLLSTWSFPSASQHPTVTRATATATVLPLPTSIIVVRLSGFVQQNRVAPFHITSEDAAKVTQLYNIARALPRTYAGPGCPEDRAIGYEVTLMHGATVILQVLMICHCHMLEVSGLPGCRDWPPSFTTQVADTLGVLVTTLYPATPDGLLNTAGPNGPFAQAVPTEPVLVSEKCSY